jgi:hypothetical protein
MSFCVSQWAGGNRRMQPKMNNRGVQRRQLRGYLMKKRSDWFV